MARNAEGKVVFVEGALPGERAAVCVFSKKRKFETARARQILQSSAGRREPNRR